MKFPFFKSIMVLGAVAVLINCSDDESTTAKLPNENAFQSTEIPATSDACWVFNAGSDFLIYPTGVVTDVNGNIIGSIEFQEGVYIGNIKDANGNVLFENVTMEGLPISSLNDIASKNVTDSSAVIILSSASEIAPTLTSSTSELPVASSSSITQQIIEVSSSSNAVQQVEISSSSETKAPVTQGNVTVTGNLSQTVAQSGKTQEVKFSGLSAEPTRLSWNVYFLQPTYSNGVYTIPVIEVPEYFQTGEISEFFKVNGKDYELKFIITAKGGATQPQQSLSSSSQQQQVKSSSSAKSSSSQQQQVKSSSSAKSSSSQQQTSGTTTLKYVAGGASGSGWATRYWDCCKPSCSWTTNTNYLAKTCDVRGNKISDNNATSTCEGGIAATCVSQIPIIVNDNLAYAFAAVPASNGGQCGKCFALEFTGKGKYETKQPHVSIKGKTLVVMASNIGTDVSQGQFDVMIPGGGVGIYNGCANMGWGSQGEQYGGLLSDCEKEVGYSATNIEEKRVQCLTNKCNSVFANDSKAKQGCLFLATWMHAAGNPLHNYREVECPAELKAQY